MTSAATAVAAPQKTGGNGAAGPDGYRGPTTPAARRLTREHGVDLALIAGSGHSGRVTREDILKFVESGGANAAPAAQAKSAQAQEAPAELSATAARSASSALRARARTSSRGRHDLHRIDSRHAGAGDAPGRGDRRARVPYNHVLEDWFMPNPDRIADAVRRLAAY